VTAVGSIEHRKQSALYEQKYTKESCSLKETEHKEQTMESNSALVKYSSLLGDWLQELGYTHCFFVAGGGCCFRIFSTHETKMC
jgi:hypothetical protein